jgi:hypothetical protein
MEKRKTSLIAAVSIVIILGLILPSFSSTWKVKPIEIECAKSRGVVDKRPGESFTVKITFKNIGTTIGSWNVNIAFEGEWNWNGTAKNLTLKPCHKKTLTWEGEVPEEASVNSFARLIVYFDGEFIRLDWWIHVVEAAELTIVSSTLE